MEATFVVKPSELTPEVLDRMLRVFGDIEESVIITMKAARNQPVLDQRDIFRGLEEVRLCTEKVPVPPGVDIDALIDEMNDTPL